MSALDIGARGLARRAIDTQRLPDRAALQQALRDAPDNASLFLAETGREGRFTVWSAAAFEEQFGYAVADAKAADPRQGIFVATDDDARIAMRPTGNGVWQAAWFGWMPNTYGSGYGAQNRDALRAIEALICYSPSGGFYPFAPLGGMVVDLGWGQYDVGEADDDYLFERKKGNYFGHGFLQTQINWKGAANATVVRWDSSAAGFFKSCRLGNGVFADDPKPKRWIDCSWNGDGINNITDWSTNFDNFYGDVTNDPDAAALVLVNVVNFSMREVRFSGGTRHILVQQGSANSNKRGLTIDNYTFDYRNGGAGTFSEHICVDITGSGSLVLNLRPTRLEGSAAAAVGAANNPALVRVRDTVGPNAIGQEAVTLNLLNNAGFDFGTTAQFWLVHHDTPQVGLLTNINAPFGMMLFGFQGLQGGNWNTTWKAPEPTFSAGGSCIVSPYSNARQSSGAAYLGYDIRAGHALALGNGATPGIVASGSGNPEGVVTAPPGSLYIRQDGNAGNGAWRKNSGTGNTGWINISQTKGAINGTTDANGDILITHGFGTTPTKVNAKIAGPTLYHTAVDPSTIGATTFKVRVFTAAGAAAASTAVAGWWEAETAP